MIIVQLIGGLGNQLFQYALGRHLAEKNSTVLKLDLSEFEAYKLRRYELNCFDIRENIATNDEVETFKCENNIKNVSLMYRIGKRFGYKSSPTSNFYQKSIVLKEKEFTYNPSIINTKGNIYLNGYWQSEKYFIEIRDILMKELTVKYRQSYKNKELSRIISNTESVSIHFRRGDYINDPVAKKVLGTCSLNYYRKAVNYIIQYKPNSHFFVFSDEPQWVKENFKLPYPFTIVDNNANYDYEDLNLMSLCRNNIIANSSFSWWGAWLNKNQEKIVCAPERWFKDPLFNSVDLIPESWIKINDY